MSHIDDNFIDAQLRRYEYPDGRCYRCGQMANRHAPVGPRIVTVVDGDENEETHEFCDWTCFGHWAAMTAGGILAVDPN
jgi:hypothetical protein